MFTFLILLTISVALTSVYIPNRKDINSIGQSSYKILQIKVQKSRERRYGKRPEPSIEDFLKDRYKKKAIERRKDAEHWSDNFQRELVQTKSYALEQKAKRELQAKQPVSQIDQWLDDRMRYNRLATGQINSNQITAGLINPILLKPMARRSEDLLGYSERIVQFGANVYESPDNQKRIRTLAAGEIVSIKNWTTSVLGHVFLHLSKGGYITVGATSSKSVSGLPFVAMPKPLTEHIDFETVTMRTADSMVVMTHQYPITYTHPYDESCHRCESKNAMV